MTPLITLPMCVAVLCFYAFFYKAVVKHWGPFVQPLIERIVPYDRYPSRELDAVGKLTAATLAQGAFALLLAAILVLGIDRKVEFRIEGDILILGCLLGFAELVASSFLCMALVHLSVATSADGTRVAREWIGQGKGGWMGQFGATVRIAPPWFAAIVIATYVSIEEIVFRGIIIELLRPLGAVLSISISACMFVAVQRFHMPGTRAAMFPMIGAAIIGLTHGTLYWRVPDLSPLVLAHLTFFAAALDFTDKKSGEWYSL